MTSFQFRTMNALLFLAASAMLAACAPAKESSTSTAAAIAAYCATPITYASPVTVTGTATYEWRTEGNGVIVNGNNAFKPSSTAATTYSFRIIVKDTSTNISSAPQTISYICPTNCIAKTVVTGLINAVNGHVNYVDATGERVLGLNVYPGHSITVDTLQNVTALSPNPIRYAEINVTDANGNIVQCGETSGTGTFSLDLPGDGATYTVRVKSRANNTHNTAFVMNTPSANAEYELTQTVVAAGSPSALTLKATASASGDLLGGAFNILDQIENAQDYLRAQTAGCAGVFAQCIPVTTVPLIHVYWKKGLSPGTYVGISGGISFYSTGLSELYILGGINGDVDNSDADHFDNSVIVHEYGHFIEDMFGKPDSPGGSHDGDSVIDPRLAWGEGWADFFQAAVRNDPYYRDTIGSIDCSATWPPHNRSCTSVPFDEYLDPSGGSYKDKPATDFVGEGNFREFSVTRVLWDVVKSGGVSQFSEIWTALHGSSSMRTASDVFKSLGRLHYLQTLLTGHTDWSTIAGNEQQQQSMKDYGNPLSIVNGCAPASTTMNIKMVAGDLGYISDSDLFRNNDFVTFTQSTTGPVTIKLTWSGADLADLDLYLYKSGYAFGTSQGRVGYSFATTSTTSGTETITKTLEPGQYMINVNAYTGMSYYQNHTGMTFTTSYQLKINGVDACPTM